MNVENALAIIAAYDRRANQTAEQRSLLIEARTAVWDRAETIRLGRAERPLTDEELDARLEPRKER